MAGTNNHGGRRGTIITAINVTPLVDVVLVLLIIMMVASTYIVAQTLKVQLPRTQSTDGTVDDPTVLTLLADGGVLWNDVPIGQNDVAAAIRDARKQSGDISLVVSADANVPHGRVVHFIDIAKSSGVRKFAINVEATR